MEFTRRSALVGLCIGVIRAAEPDEFTKWFADFRALVAKGDKAGVASQSKFPMYWENGPVREIRTADEFTKNFEKYFTSEIRKMIATRTPKAAGESQRLITWNARGNEYSIYFKKQGAKYVLNGLSEGPP